MREGLQAQRGKLVGRLHANPALSEELDRIDRDLAVVDAEIAKRQGVAQPSQGAAPEPEIELCMADDCENKARTGGRCAKHHKLWKAEQEAAND